MDATKYMPPMLTGDELLKKMAVYPDYDENIREASAGEKLIALSALYRLYVPSQMSMEIYSKIYLALLRSLQKKQSKLAVIQNNQNARGCKGGMYEGIIGGSDSFTIIAQSGAGKSSAISRSIQLIGADRIITTEKNGMKIVPCVVVQCPFDSSVKGILLEILRVVDERLGSEYCQKAIRAKATTDMLIGSVSQVALNHIGLLVVDEIQNVVANKQGKNLIGALTQLINNSGISICMVGTPECLRFFQEAPQLARRSLGLQYTEFPLSSDFELLCKTLFRYVYVREAVDVDTVIIQWLYEHSGGIAANVVSLIHDAMELAIMNGLERLNIETLNLAYKQRMKMLHGHVTPCLKSLGQKQRKRDFIAYEQVLKQQYSVSIAELVVEAKNQGQNIIDTIRQYYAVEEVRL